jgi:two-component system NtrC family response regulator
MSTRPAVSSRGTVLVVDDEQAVRASLSAILKTSCNVLEARNGRQALEMLGAHPVDLVMLDQRMPGEEGLDVLLQIKAIDPTILVVLATAVREVKTAVEALKRGAYDYITKPFEVDDIVLLVQRALEKRMLEREVLCLRSELARTGIDHGGRLQGIIGRHPDVLRIHQLILQVAPMPTTVLITGESGTGKELVARAIHEQSPRSDKPFVAFNVAAFPDTLIDSELWGHEKGAFTGAHAARQGRFEAAQGGSLFLDEIGDLPLHLQVKLLRVLQEREIERLGSSRSIGVDVRLLAATHRDLESAVRAGTFRDDLYYRINVVTVTVPPLRDRRADIPPLLEHFLMRLARDNSKPIRGLTAEARDALLRYDYPGNVRELENLIERAVVLTRDDVIGLGDLPLGVREPAVAADDAASLPAATEGLERRLIHDALVAAGGVQTRAAEALGISERVLRYKLRKYGLRA